MNNDWLKLKVARDLKKIKNAPNYLGITIYSNSEVYRIKSKFSKEYRNLIELVTNTLNYYENTSKEISQSNLDNMNFDLLVEVSKLNNVNVVDQPAFTYYSVDEHTMTSHQNSVIDFEGDALNHILHSNNIFFIYQIKKDKSRFKEIVDNKYCKSNRKNKLEKISNNQN